MFVRRYNRKLKDGRIASHAYLVKNRWNSVKKKTQQKIVAALGKVEELPHSGVIEEIITALDKFAKEQGFASLSKGIVLKDLSSKEFLRKTYDWGSLLLTSHLLKTLSFENIIKSCFEKNRNKNKNKDEKEGEKEDKKKDKKKNISLKKIMAAIPALLAYQLQGHSTVSERKTYLWYKNKVFLPNKQNFNKNDFYRTLDFLYQNKDEIEKQYYQKNQNLFNQELDLVLFDTTSIYYWGEKGEAAQKTKTSYQDSPNTDLPEALLKYSGHSKDKRTDLKQLMVGVLMAEDLEGNAVPVAHETFPGNQSDFVSFPQVIEKVKKKYQQYKIGKIIFVADKGMASEENLRNLEEQKEEYILGARTRQLNPILKKALIFNTGAYDDQEHNNDQEYLEQMKKIKDNLYAKEFKMKDFLKTGSIWPHPNPGKKNKNKKINGKDAIDEIVNNIYKNLDFYKSKTGDEKKDKQDIKRCLLKRRYFICFNPFIAKDNQAKRKFFRKVIKNKIKYQQNKKWIIKNGYKKYLKIGKLDLKLDKEKLSQEKYYDGKWILVTNNQTMNPSLAAKRYKSLRFVEQGFKDLKSLIKIRPIFHSKEERIKAHVFAAFLVLILKWYLYQKLDSTSQKTGKRFIEKMNNLKSIEVDKKHQVFVRTEINPKLQKQMKTLGLKIPPKIILDKRPVKKQWKKQVGRPRKEQSANWRIEQQKLI